MTKTRYKDCRRGLLGPDEIKSHILVEASIKRINRFPLPALSYFTRIEGKETMKKKEETPSSKN